MAMGHVTLADKLAPRVCEALGISPDMTARIVIDMRVGDVTRVYVEMVGSSELLNVDWALDGAEITMLEGDG